MAKIVIIGAGSHVFSKHLITDILTFPALRNSTITLMDIDKEPLALIETFGRKIVKQNGFKTKIEATTNRREALTGADYVVISIRVGSMKELWADRNIPIKYGIKQAVGDTLGPGGVFYGLRHIPVILDMCRDMEELCPDALLLNYTNPMAMICWAINDYTSIKNVGLCHSVQGSSAELSRYIGKPIDEMSFWVAGINHMAWFLEFKWRGEDAYPLLREKFKDAAVYSKVNAHWAGEDNVRAEIFKAFGYFNTESSSHMSEYTPYFRKRPELMERFNLDYEYTAAKFDYDKMAANRKIEDAKLKKQISSGYKFPLEHSGEFGSIIIHSIETGIPSRINGNVKNNGLITNLPEGCCVEVPCLVDKKGISPCYVGELPAQCAALNRTNINVQELGVRGICEKDKTKLLHAIMLDPLTSAVLTLDETRSMVGEMFKAQAGYLKGFK